jgi:hypothetical protein
MKRRGFAPGTPPNRLSDEQRWIIVGMLKAMPVCARVTRDYNVRIGKVTLTTVCKIKRQAIEAGYLSRDPLKKELRT